MTPSRVEPVESSVQSVSLSILLAIRGMEAMAHSTTTLSPSHTSVPPRHKFQCRTPQGQTRIRFLPNTSFHSFSLIS